jgi:hypothetical protein
MRRRARGSLLPLARAALGLSGRVLLRSVPPTKAPEKPIEMAFPEGQGKVFPILFPCKDKGHGEPGDPFRRADNGMIGLFCRKLLTRPMLCRRWCGRLRDVGKQKLQSYLQRSVRCLAHGPAPAAIVKELAAQFVQGIERLCFVVVEQLLDL